MLPCSPALRGAVMTLATLIALSALPALAQQDHHTSHPEGHAPTDEVKHHQHHAGGDIAPIGLMGTHMHPAGEFMLSYLYTRMGMDGNLDGDDHISRSKILSPAGENFLVTPTSMDMEMHMFRLMVAPMDQLTLMAMLPYLVIEMDHRTRMGAKFTTRSRGVGDFKISALIGLYDAGVHHLHANVGLSFPTGRINGRDKNPMSMGNSVRLPYPMQHGSGTYDFLPGLTYTGTQDGWDWGAQASGVVRMNESHADYTLGNRYELTAWVGRQFLPWVSATFRLDWQHWMNIDGRDKSFEMALNGRLVPTVDPGRRAGRRLDALFGLSFNVPSGPFEGIRLALEGGVPAYQHLDGPQLETDYRLTAGVQYWF
jgi:hypothetical protein